MTTEVFLKSSLILIRILLYGLIIIQQFRAVDTHGIVILEVGAALLVQQRVRNSNNVSKKKLKEKLYNMKTTFFFFFENKNVAQHENNI